MDYNNFTNQFNQVLKLGSDYSPIIWCASNYLLNGKTPLTYINPFDSLHHRNFHLEILKNHTNIGNGRNVCICKGRQLGMSELGTEMILYELCTSKIPRLVLFTFPTYGQLYLFIKSRINPVIQSNPLIREKIVNDSLDSKEFSNGSFLICRSSSSNQILEGIASSSVYLDEANLVEQSAIDSAIQGQSGYRKDERLLSAWSTPTFDGVGISKLYNRSNQNVWCVKCNHCSKWQELSFQDSIVCVNPKGVNEQLGIVQPDSYRYECLYCHQELSRETGMYVPRYPNRQDEGYLISQLGAVWKSADEIMQNYFTMSVQFFHNYILGTSYTSAGYRLFAEDVKACQVLEYTPINQLSKYRAISVGIDWNTKNWATVCGVNRLTNETEIIDILCEEDDPQEPLRAVENLCQKLLMYHPSIVVSDRGYGADRNKLVSKYFKDKAWTVQFLHEKPNSPSINATWNEQKHEVSMPKLSYYLDFINRVKQQSIKMPKSHPLNDEYISHCENMRIGEQEEEIDGVLTKNRVYARAGHDDAPCSTIISLLGLSRITTNGQTQDIFVGFW